MCSVHVDIQSHAFSATPTCSKILTLVSQGAPLTFSKMTMGGSFFLIQSNIPLKVWPDSPLPVMVFFSLFKFE